jgi:hypothetical protein
MKMCKEHEITQKTCLEYLIMKESFTWDELQEDVFFRGGVFRYQVGFTLGQWLCENEEDGVVSFNLEDKKYHVNQDHWYIMGLKGG